MKRSILIIWAIGLALSASARDSRYGSWEHHGVFSMGVAECNSLTSAAFDEVAVTDMHGMNMMFGVGYELYRNGLFGGLKWEFDYNQTRQQLQDYDAIRTGYADRVSGGGEVQYHYIYNQFVEYQHQVSHGSFFYFGGNFAHDFYALGGLKLCVILVADYRTHVTLTTRKMYNDIFGDGTEWVEVEEPWAADGNYPAHPLVTTPCKQFTWDDRTSANNNPLRFRLAPVLEIGWKHAFRDASYPTELRLGAFAEWGIPLFSTQNHTLELVDYSNIESRTDAAGRILIPASQTQLDELIRFNSVLNSQYVDHSSRLSITQITVGVKLSVVLGAYSACGKTRSRSSCHCLPFH